MIRNRSRSDLRNDILMSLGHPIIKVNLTEAMLDQCINSAMKQFWRWHHDGSYENYYYYELTAQDVTRGFFFTPENVDSVVEILPNAVWSSATFGNPSWHMARDTVFNQNRLLPVSLVDYTAMMMRLNDISQVLGKTTKNYTWIRLEHKVIPFFEMKEGDGILMRVYELVDPEYTNESNIEAGLVFDNETIKKLAVAYAKQMWGRILTKYAGIQLPGGITLDGSAVLQEGNQEEEAVMQHYANSQVPDFFIG